MANPLMKRVSIDVGLTRPRTPREIPPRLCVFGVVPMNAPVISELLPAVTIRTSPVSNKDPFIEQVRLSSPLQQRFLPAIGMKDPSKLRDAFNIILTAGAPEVDFVLARAPGLKPWDLEDPEIVEMFVPYMNANQGAIIVFPDAGGPWPRTYGQETTDLHVRMRKLQQTMKTYSPYLSDNFQLGLMDMVTPPDNEVEDYLFSLQGNDVALCTWSGQYNSLRKHGWRSACSAVAGFMSGRQDMLTQSMIGQQIPLGQGRKIIENRSTLFGAPKQPPVSPKIGQTCVILELNSNGRQAEIQTEMSFRRPMNEWALPALRTVKAVHLALIRASELFVFRPVQKVEAIALKTAVEMVLEPFYNMGIIVGPDGIGKPEITSDAIPDYEEPMLTVDLSAQVRPWCQSISLRVMVKSGTQPILTEA